MSRLEGPAEVIERFAEHGVRTVADVLAGSECVRDLPDRSNHRMQAGPYLVHVKRRKGAHEAREAGGMRRAAAAGVPTALLVFEGIDDEHGAVTGTLDLAPARPLDDLLRAGMAAAARRRALEELAQAVAALHGAGLHHRDLYLCHVFCSEAGALAALIDLERLGAHRRPLGRRVIKDLAALASSVPEGTTSERERAVFLLRYLRARGIDRRGTYDRLVRRIRRKTARIHAHVPRTPVGDAARPRTGDA